MRISTATDHALLQRWRKLGDPAAFNVLVDRHAAMVHATSMRVVRNRALAQEVAQDSFLKLTQLDRFDGPSVGGWLHRVATNRALDVAKAEARRHARDTAYDATREPAPSPESAAILAEIDAALAALPDDARELIILHYLEGATQKEIATRLRVSRATVARNLQRALAQLREQLGARNVTASIAALFVVFEASRATALETVFIESLRKLALRAPNSAIVRFRGLSAATLGVPAVISIIAIIIGISWLSRTSETRTDNAVNVTSPTAAASISSQALENLISSPEEVVQLASTTDPEPTSTHTEEATTILRCVDADGNPVPDAEVYVVRRKGALFAATPEDVVRQVWGPFKSDEDGHVAIPKLQEQSVNDFVANMAYASVPGKLVGAWSFTPYRDVPRPNDWDRITLVPARTLAGAVTVPQGFDPQSVTVRLLSLRVRVGIGTTRGSGFSNASKLEDSIIPPLTAQHPDRYGKFAFTGLPETGAYYLAATGPGLAETQSWNYEEVPIKPISIEMKPEAQIFGTVRYNTTGAPASDAAVFAYPRGGGTSTIGVREPFVAHTDHLGRFRFTGLPAELYTVMTPPKDDWVASVKAGLRVDQTQQVGPIGLVYEHGGLVEGFVRDAETSAPIPDVMLCAMNPDELTWSQELAIVVTDENGHYQFRLPTGSSHIYYRAIPRAYAYPDDQGRKFVAIGQNPREPVKADFTLKAGEPYTDPGTATITGRVLNVIGRPQPDVPVYDDAVVGKRGIDMTRGLVARTDSDGRYRVSVSAKGTHKICIGGGNGLRKNQIVRFSYTEMRELSPEKDKTYDLGDCVVEEYKETVSGVVTDESGKPVPRVRVGLASDDPHFASPMQIIDETGRFNFQYVPKGHFKLWVSTDTLLLGPGEPESSFASTEMEVDSGFDYTIVLKRKPEEPPH